MSDISAATLRVCEQALPLLEHQKTVLATELATVRTECAEQSLRELNDGIAIVRAAMAEVGRALGEIDELGGLPLPHQANPGRDGD